MRFYASRVKPLYAYVQTFNEFPVEMHFEINAAFDHMASHWNSPNTSENVVMSVCGHLKRSCFDAYKLVLQRARLQYDRLCNDDSLSLIDNGKFESNLHELWSKIEKGANKARFAESMSRSADHWGNAFELWDSVFDMCTTLRDDYFLSDKVTWANNNAGKIRWKERLWTIGISFIVGLLVAYIASRFL